MELTLGDIAVIATQLLLGAQLHAVVGELALAALPVLAGAVFASVHRTFRATPDVLGQPAIDLVLGFTALGHRVLSLVFRFGGTAPSFVPNPSGTDRLDLESARSCRGSRKRPTGLKNPSGVGYLGVKRAAVKPLKGLVRRRLQARLRRDCCRPAPGLSLLLAGRHRTLVRGASCAGAARMTRHWKRRRARPSRRPSGRPCAPT